MIDASGATGQPGKDTAKEYLQYYYLNCCNFHAIQAIAIVFLHIDLFSKVGNFCC